VGARLSLDEGKVRVDIEEVTRVKEYLASINQALLKDIEWYRNGVKVEVSPENLETWRMVGLNNADFCLCGNEFFPSLPEESK
jgi:hypothetical protein